MVQTYILVLAALILSACGTDPEPAAVIPDVQIIDDDNGTQPNAAWRFVPMKRVGDPIAVGSAAIGLTDVSGEVGLPVGQASHISFVDWDDDGWPDLTIVGERGLQFFRNVGGTFQDVTSELIGDWSVAPSVSSTAWGDVDGDGDLDLYCCVREGPDQLLVQQDRRFEPAGDKTGLPEALESQSVNMADVNGDGFLDIYVNEGRLTAFAPVFPPKNPGYEGTANHLLLNDGQGRFTEVTEQWNAGAGDTSETFGAVFFDYDRDGDQDLLVVRDFLSEHLLRNEEGAGFDDTGGLVISDQNTSFMGLGIGDMNGDGHLDVYATDFGSDWVYQGNGQGAPFENVYQDWLQGADPTPALVGWGLALVDLDNDGDQDVVNVAAYDKPGAQFDDSPGKVGAYVVLENETGALRDITEEAGLERVVHGFSLATADFDLDGDPDIAVGLEAPPIVNFGPDRATIPVGVRLLRNDSARGAGKRFLEVSLRHPGAPNAWAIGAIIDVETPNARASRVVTSGSSHKASHSFVQHFGMGDASRADVTVSWPDGVVTRAHGVPSGYVRLEHHEGDCCWDGAQCDSPWVQCPIWIPAGDPCGGQPCDICDLVCTQLATCGTIPSADECAVECASAGPAPSEAECILAADCSNVAACIEAGVEGPATP